MHDHGSRVVVPDQFRMRIGPVEFGDDEVEAAVRVIVQFAARHDTEVGTRVGALDAAWRSAVTDFDAAAVERCVLLAHDLGGFGGTLGYPIVTDLCRSLARYLRLDRATLLAAREVVAIHISALQVVAARRITGDGGRLGREIGEELARAISRFNGARYGRARMSVQVRDLRQPVLLSDGRPTCRHACAARRENRWWCQG